MTELNAVDLTCYILHGFTEDCRQTASLTKWAPFSNNTTNTMQQTRAQNIHLMPRSRLTVILTFEVLRNPCSSCWVLRCSKNATPKDTKKAPNVRWDQAKRVSVCLCVCVHVCERLWEEHCCEVVPPPPFFFSSSPFPHTITPTVQTLDRKKARDGICLRACAVKLFCFGFLCFFFLSPKQSKRRCWH